MVLKARNIGNQTYWSSLKRMKIRAPVCHRREVSMHTGDDPAPSGPDLPASSRPDQ